MTETSPRQLRRSIGLGPAIALYVGAVIGAGVLVLPGEAATMAGAGSLIAWLIDCVLGIPIALTFAALAALYPDAGGVSVYVAKAFGAAWGAVIGWFYYVASAVGQAAVTLTGGYYVAHALGGGGVTTYVTAAIILGIAMVSNLRGIRVSGRVQIVLSGGVVLILASATLAAVPRMDWAALSLSSGLDTVAIGRTAVLLFFAFFGWEAIAHLSEEFHDPKRDVPRATLVAVIVITVLYLGIALAVLGTGMYGTPEVNRTALARLLGASFGVSAEIVAAGVAALISLGTANAFIAAASRLAYALARDGAFPSRLSKLNAKAVPATAIIATTVLAAAALLASFLLEIGAAQILLVPSSLGLCTYILGMAAAVKLLNGTARVLAIIGLLPCMALLPFALGSLVFPVGVALAALLYRHASRARGARRKN